MTSSLIETKFYRPRARAGSVPRSRLAEALDRGSSATLTLVSAPAGFGKTTLLAQWLEHLSLDGGTPSVAWLSLDVDDNEPRRYWTYLLAALRAAAPDLGVKGPGSSQTAIQLAVQPMLTELINDLSASSGVVYVVLDDYHVIESREVHEAMAFLIEHAPPQLRLVIASRADPAVPLARLRARGELAELRVNDLRFTADEAASYYNEVMGLDLTVAQLSTLGERTEGWITALQLAALSMQGRKDVTRFIENFTGDDSYIVDYLVEEVLQHQPEPIGRFLLQTSILRQFTGALCDAVTGQDHGRATLEALDRANLFLVPLDDQRRWYRYHHLFADVLRARLRDEWADMVGTLHQRASSWYAEHGQQSEAIRHSLAGGDFERAADLIEREFPASRRDRRETTLLGWLKKVPDDVLRQRPVLCVVYAGTLLSTGTSDGVEQLLSDAEGWLSTPDAMRSTDMVVVDEAELRRLPGWVAIYRAAQALARGDAKATVEHAERAMTLLDERDPFANGAASALLGLASWGRGDLDAAYQAYTTCSDLFRQDGYASDVMACAITLGDIRVTQGRLREAMTTYQQALPPTGQDDDADGTQALRGAPDMYVGMSALHVERNDLAAAKECLERAAALGEASGLPQNKYRWRVAMARVHEAEGDLETAVALVEEAERAYVADFSPELRPVSALKARLWAKAGRLDLAFEWARQRDLTVDDELSFRREFEHLTLARMLMARFAADETEGDLAAVRSFLGGLLRAADDGGRSGTALEVLVLQALVEQLRGETSVALDALDRAMKLAAPEGYVRTFLNEGPPMTALLSAAVSIDGAAPAYARLLLADATAESKADKPRPTQDDALVEPLSARERDVLRLLATDLGGPEIARQLVVSLSTVRTHTRGIYAKLGVSSRRAAVSRASELNLLGHPPRR